MKKVCASTSRLLSDYNPLQFWNFNCTEFPNIFKLNKISLVYIVSSGFQESIFSVGSKFGTPERNDLISIDREKRR